jgi:hypothetical protein
MLSNVLKRLQDIFKPYTLENFIEDSNPKDYKDIERLEKIWHNYRVRKQFNSHY